MAKWLEQLESFIGGGPGGPRRIKAFRWLVLIGLIGAALLLIASLVNIKTVPPQNDLGASPPPSADTAAQQTAVLSGDDDNQDPFYDVETSLESRVKGMLEKIVGVGEADVMINVESTEESVVQLDEQQQQQLTDETDRNGATRHITQINKQGQVELYEVSKDGVQAPIVVKKLRPEVRGVLVVAQGAENATVQKLIIQAVSRGLDVPLHRISVVPRKQ